MKIGIDISQVVYEKTGVSEYVRQLISYLLHVDYENEYVLFYSSLRKNFQFSIFNFQSIPKNVKVKKFMIPLSVLDFLWNRLHIVPVEWLIGNINVFVSSDWIEPPTINAKKVTILYDLIVYKYPKETDKKIIDVQKRRLSWVKKEADKVICISESTKKDAMEILKIDKEKLSVVYPGV